MSQNFMKSKLPPIYNQKYLDPIRQKPINITPEETVRQHLISYLIENLQVPKTEINVEQSLTYHDTNSKLRADIVIYCQFKNIHYPVAVIECKAPEISLYDDKFFKQVLNYANKIGCNYCWLTNGEENFYFYYEKNKNRYAVIEEFPKYLDLLQGKYSPIPVEKFFKRINSSTANTACKINIVQALLNNF